MANPLMPKATAAWLIDNTALTFEQIAEFCGLHPLEIQALADGDIGMGMMGVNPLHNGELNADEIARCENNPSARLKMMKTSLPQPQARSKGPRYTPINKRGEKPNAVAYLLKKHPDLTDTQVARLIGSTKPTVAAIRNKTHPLGSTLKPVDPVLIGLCTSEEINKAVKKTQRLRTPQNESAEDAQEDGTNDSF